MVTEPRSVYIVTCEAPLDNVIIGVFDTRRQAQEDMQRWADEDPNGTYAIACYEIGWSASSEGVRYHRPT